MAKKQLEGVVIRLKNQKTAAVEITEKKIHPKYLKVVKRKKVIQAHYLDNFFPQLGDKVTIVSSKPYSATKRFLVTKIHQRSAGFRDSQKLEDVDTQ